jgi:hypothetical protein
MDTRNTYIPTIGWYQWILIHPHTPISDVPPRNKTNNASRDKESVFTVNNRDTSLEIAQRKAAARSNPHMDNDLPDMDKGHHIEEHLKGKPIAHQNQKQALGSSTDHEGLHLLQEHKEPISRKKKKE